MVLDAVGGLVLSIILIHSSLTRKEKASLLEGTQTAKWAFCWKMGSESATLSRFQLLADSLTLSLDGDGGQTKHLPNFACLLTGDQAG